MSADEIFSVTSVADLGLVDIYLSDAQAEHIRRGHRELAPAITTLVKTAVTSPTQVYSSFYHGKRWQFVADNVTTKRGHPMSVVVERDGNRGKIITATPKNSLSGTLVWKSDTNIYSHFDAEADIFYISKGPAVDAYASEEGNIWLRSSEETDEPVGVTVFEFRSMWSAHKDDVISKISSFLRIMHIQVRERVDAVMS